MMSYNRIVLVGNLTRDPEIKTFGNDGKVAVFGIAVNERVKNGQGQWEDKPMFVDCAIFNRGNFKAADTFAQHMKKGSLVLIEGKLVQDQWKDKQTGENRNRHKIVVDNFQFMERKQDSQQGGGQGGGQQRGNQGGQGSQGGQRGNQSNQNAGGNQGYPDDYQGGNAGGEDDIPF